MKHIICVFIFLMFAQLVKAQHAYIPIPKDSTIWVMVVEDWHEGQFPKPPNSYTYNVGVMQGKDTIINSKTYSCYFGDWPNSFMPEWTDLMYAKVGDWLRQDTVNKKVWYVRHHISPYEEELLYDFNLQKGDTITDTNYYYLSPNRLYPHKAWVDNIDSVYWTDGTWRYRWWINSTYGSPTNPAKVVVIEGMGYTAHPINDPLLLYHPLVSTTNSVVCYKVRNNWLYKQNNPWNADCDTMIWKNIVPPISVENVFITELNEPLLYPNPVKADGSLTINSYAGNVNDSYEITAYSYTGQKILSVEKHPGEKIMLQHYNLNSGLYLFILSNNKRPISRQKIIIQ